MKKITLNPDKIKSLAKKKKILLMEIYQALGVSRQHFSHMLKTDKLTASKIAQVCEILDCVPNDLFDIEEVGEHIDLAAEPPTGYGLN
jgi:DNA-binding Xre family transcriptional regulator